MVILRYFFNLACFIITFGMTVLWLYRYSLDEDIAQFDVRPFDFLEGQHPMLSFCLIDPVIESKLREYNEALTGEKYIQILRGDRSFSGIRNISFDEVTLNLADFYLRDSVRFRNGTFKRGYHPNFFQGLPQVTNSGFRGGIFKKCYTRC